MAGLFSTYAESMKIVSQWRSLFYRAVSCFMDYNPGGSKD